MESVKERVLALCEARGIKIGTLEKQAKMSNGTISKWTDETIPSGVTLQIIADFFNVSVDYLLGRESAGDDEIMALREQLRRQPGMRILFSASKNATKEQLEAMAEMIKKWTT